MTLGSSKWKSIRYTGYDYTQANAYAFTVVVHERVCLLGSIKEQAFRPSAAGEIVRGVWQKLPERFSTIVLDAFVVMPNHIHGLVFLGANPIDYENDAINGEPTQSLVSSPLTASTTHPAVVSPFMAATPQSSVASPLMATTTPKEKLPSLRTSTNRRPPTPPSRDPARPALGEIVRSLKASSATQIRKQSDPNFAWQPNYWDRIIRNDFELERYRAYIENNPSRWEDDKEFMKGDW